MTGRGPDEAATATGTIVAAACANCDAPLTGPYCQECGQKRASLVGPLRALVEEALEVVFDLDNALLRTLRRLVRRPGALTLDYLEGRRARYLLPSRLYLLTSIVYFALAGLTVRQTMLFVSMGDTEGAAAQALVDLMPRFMVVMVPAFALVLKAMLRRRLYAEHLVFAVHVHAAWFLLYSIDTVAQPFAAPITLGRVTPVTVLAALVSGAAQIGSLVYLFLAIRRVYGLNRGRALAATIVALLGYFAMLAAAVVTTINVVPGILDDG